MTEHFDRGMAFSICEQSIQLAFLKMNSDMSCLILQ